MNQQYENIGMRTQLKLAQTLRLKIPQEVISRRTLNPSFNNKEGSVKVNVGNRLTHELAKTKLLYLLKKQGHEVVTEAIFVDQRGRADILDITTGTIWEVLDSETLENARKKEIYYPVVLGIEYLRAEEILKEGFEV